MKIVLTGSLGNIGKPLAEALVQKGHDIIVISSSPERKQAIEAIGARPAIGSITDYDFISDTLTGADAVYLMVHWEAVGSLYDTTIDFEQGLIQIGTIYKKAVERAGIKKVVYLSTIGAHTNKGTGVLAYHYNVEQLLSTLPAEVSVSFIRPVGFYTNLYRSIPHIKAKGTIIQNFGTAKKEPWVSPHDIADVISHELENQSKNRSVVYVASEELSVTDIVSGLRNASGLQDLEWVTISDEAMLEGLLKAGMNTAMARGYVEMQAAQRIGYLYEDYYQSTPHIGKVKFAEFAKEFANKFSQDS